MATAFRDYYATLGVPRTATEKEVKTAFRKLARKYHPDVNQDNKDAEARFKEVTEAYEVLGDPEKRKTYDEIGSQPAGFPGFHPAGRRGTAGGPQVEYRTVSPEDMRVPLRHHHQPLLRLLPRHLRPRLRGLPGGDAHRRGRGAAPRPSPHAPARQRRRGGGGDQPRGGLPGNGPHPGADRRGRHPPGGGPHPGRDQGGAKVRASGQGSPGADSGQAGDLLVKVRLRPHHTFTREGGTTSGSASRYRSGWPSSAAASRSQPWGASGSRSPSLPRPRTAPSSGCAVWACPGSVATRRAT